LEIQIVKGGERQPGPPQREGLSTKRENKKTRGCRKANARKGKRTIICTEKEAGKKPADMKKLAIP